MANLFSQRIEPGLNPRKGTTWPMKIRSSDGEVHTLIEEKPGRCSDPHLPPCTADHGSRFSRDAWRCVWHIKNFSFIYAFILCNFLLDIHDWQHDRAAWLMKPKDSLVYTVAENLLDRLEDSGKRGTWSN